MPSGWRTRMPLRSASSGPSSLSSTREGRRRVTRKARTLYRQHAGWLGRLLIAVPPLFELAFRRGWVRLDGG